MSIRSVWTGVVRMDRLRYRELAGLAGEWLEAYIDGPLRVGDSSGHEERAIYVVENGMGMACYAGQTHPADVSRGVAGVRIRQHLREPSKAAEWELYWVIPLRPGTPDVTVDHLEHLVCSRLGLPVRNRRWQRRASAVTSDARASLTWP